MIEGEVLQIQEAEKNQPKEQEREFYPIRPEGKPTEEEIIKFLGFIEKFRDYGIVLVDGEKTPAHDYTVNWKYSGNETRGYLGHVKFITLNKEDWTLTLEQLDKNTGKVELSGITAVNLEELSLYRKFGGN